MNESNRIKGGKKKSEKKTYGKPPYKLWNGEVISCNLIEALTVGEPGLRVAETFFTDETAVSTVLLHTHIGPEPMFESMVFGENPKEEEQDCERQVRYNSLENAKNGHQLLVNELLAAGKTIKEHTEGVNAYVRQPSEDAGS